MTGDKRINPKVEGFLYRVRISTATGNKSELSVGYCTLYGDTVGGLCVLGDVYKGDVYAIARYANRETLHIPENTIEKPPLRIR